MDKPGVRQAAPDIAWAAKVTYRFDTKPALTEDWSAIGASNGVFANDPRRVEALAHCAKMIFKMRIGQTS